MPAPRRAEHRKGVHIPRPPRDLASALKFSAWIVTQVARGNLSPAEGKCMTDALREFRELLGAQDMDAKVAEIKALLAEAKAPRSG